MNALIHVCDRSVIKMTKIKKNKRQVNLSRDASLDNTRGCTSAAKIKAITKSTDRTPSLNPCGMTFHSAREFALHILTEIVLIFRCLLDRMAAG